MFTVKRSRHNPILSPVRENSWEAVATFNWSPAIYNDELHVLYRAMAFPELLGQERLYRSSIGHAVITDDLHPEDRRQFIAPEEDWEKFGCEDPRIVKIEGTYYVFYTALSEFPFRADGIRVAVATTKDFKTISKRHLVTPFNAKAMTMFPEKINGKYVAIFSLHPDQKPVRTALAYFDRIEDLWSPEYWKAWYEGREEHFLDLNRREHDHVEMGATPMLTEKGWLMVYSHIQGYETSDLVFGIEAVLLDRNDPRKITGRTRGAMFTPQLIYEEQGLVPNIVFPSGALIRDGKLEVYYGATDTTCCLATVEVEDILASIIPEIAAKRVVRFDGNPIIKPIAENKWEAFATFNPAAIDIDETIYIVYRAMSKDGTSVLGIAMSKDGFHIDERLPEPMYVPREEFEIKHAPGNSGCEDPRLTIMEDGTIYMFYTAFDGVQLPRVAVTSIMKDDFVDRKWEKWSKPHLITPPGIMDKDTAIFSEKVCDKYMIIHRISDVVCVDPYDTLDFENEKIDSCIQILRPRKGMWDSVKVGIAGPPIKTEHGWLLLYHGVSKSSTYRVGAALLDFHDPATIKARTSAPIMEPKEPYEMEGQVNGVVFPCGAIVRDGVIFIYYGGGDSVIGVATVKLDDVLKMLGIL